MTTGANPLYASDLSWNTGPISPLGDSFTFADPEPSTIALASLGLIAVTRYDVNVRAAKAPTARGSRGEVVLRARQPSPSDSTQWRATSPPARKA